MKGRTVVLLLGAAALLTVAAVTAMPLLALQSAMNNTPRPPLAQGLPADFAKAELAFDARIAEAFPAGSSEAALIRHLQAEGFDLTQPNRSGPEGPDERGASFVLRGLPCVLTWRVRWRAEADRLVSTSGDYDGTCL